MEETQGYMDENKQLPIHFNRNGIVVYSNPSGEIFVKNHKSKAVIRINATELGLVFTTSDRVEPTLVTNMIGWEINPRYPGVIISSPKPAK